MTCYVYIRSEPGLYTVGFYAPDGSWKPESDHPSKETAAAQVHYLNGGHVQPGSELLAFAIRVAEFGDYTHDDVNEQEILRSLQREAAALVAKAEGRS